VSLVLLIKLLHILSVIWFMSGMVGRAVAFWQAGNTADFQVAYALAKLSDLFEQKMVIPGSMAVLGFGVLVAWLQGWPAFGFLQGADSNWLLVSLVLFLGPTPLIPMVMIPLRKQRAKAAEDSLSQGRMTSDFVAALKHKGVITYRAFEMVIAVLVAILMVVKPF
jgi:uncharacterized membrane protein